MPKTKEIMMIKDWGKPSRPVKVTVVSPNIGVNPQRWVGRSVYAVCHIPTGAAIRSLLSKEQAFAVAKELAKNDQEWAFTTKQAFAKKRVKLWERVRNAVALICS